MQNEKLFNGTILYLKIITIFSMVMCFVLMFFQSFDPMGSLEMMIVQDLYKTNVMPADARPMFVFVFLLFDMLSVLSMAAQYLVIVHGLQKKQKWAFHYMILIGVCWPIGAGIIAWYCKTPAYYVSVGMMLCLFLPPLLVLRKHCKA